MIAEATKAPIKHFGFTNYEYRTDTEFVYDIDHPPLSRIQLEKKIIRTIIRQWASSNGKACIAPRTQIRIVAACTELSPVFLEKFKYYGKAAAGGEFSHD